MMKKSGYLVSLLLSLVLHIPAAAADPVDRLGGVTGKLFKPDLANRSFELLKETEYDPKTDDPKLPRVLVVGDSISMNYHETATEALKGVANYHRNEGNAGSSAHGVRNAELWLGNWREKGFHWDVIQFNHGLHDLKQDLVVGQRCKDDVRS